MKILTKLFRTLLFIGLVIYSILVTMALIDKDERLKSLKREYSKKILILKEALIEQGKKIVRYSEGLGEKVAGNILKNNDK
jgi:hypothetical protein